MKPVREPGAGEPHAGFDERWQETGVIQCLPRLASTLLRTALKRAGLQDFHFHDLRHTFASQVILNGGSLKDVQELLGHKSMTMTLRYAHLTQESKRKAVNLLNGLTGHCHKTVTPPPPR